MSPSGGSSPHRANSSCCRVTAPGLARISGRSAYEGAFRTPGERDESADLRRYFADYDSLLAVDGARDLWNALYGPLVAADWQALEVPA
mgnify:CR=1 FL=1